MTIPFDQEPFSKLPEQLRQWLDQVSQAAEADPDHRFWRDQLPEGSSGADAMNVSWCIAKLFPERAAAENFTPVAVEFRL